MVKESVRIKYNLTVDDLVALQEFVLKQCNYFKTWRWGIILGLLIAIPYLIYTTWRSGASWQEWISTGFSLIVVGAIVFFLLLNRKREMKKTINKSLADPFAKGTIGLHEIEFSDEGLATTSQYTSSTFKWDVIKKVHCTQEHAFILIGTDSGLIIGRSNIVEGNFDELVRFLTHRCPQT